MENNLTIEENFEKLEEILKQMQEQNITLDKSFELYRDGLNIIKECTDSVQTIEKKIKVLEGKAEDE